MVVALGNRHNRYVAIDAGHSSVAHSGLSLRSPSRARVGADLTAVGLFDDEHRYAELCRVCKPQVWEGVRQQEHILVVRFAITARHGPQVVGACPVEEQPRCGPRVQVPVVFRFKISLELELRAIDEPERLKVVLHMLPAEAGIENEVRVGSACNHRSVRIDHLLGDWRLDDAGEAGRCPICSIHKPVVCRQRLHRVLVRVGG